MSKQTSEFPDREDTAAERTTRGRKRKGQYVLWQWIEYTWTKHPGYWWKVRAYEKLADAEHNKKKLEREGWFKRRSKCVILPPGQRPAYPK
jgi:hypothetical protein